MIQMNEMGQFLTVYVRNSLITIQEELFLGETILIGLPYIGILKYPKLKYKKYTT